MGPHRGLTRRLTRAAVRGPVAPGSHGIVLCPLPLRAQCQPEATEGSLALEVAGEPLAPRRRVPVRSLRGDSESRAGLGLPRAEVACAVKTPIPLASAVRGPGSEAGRTIVGVTALRLSPRHATGKEISRYGLPTTRPLA